MDIHLLDVLLFSLSIGWIVAYIDAIRIGFKEKTYCIPLLPLVLNFSWEIAASFIYPSMNIYHLVYIVWAVLDVFILVTFVKYNTEYNRNTGVVVGFLLLMAGAWQIIFAFYMTDWMIVTAFNMNLLMSFCFIHMLKQRGSSKGQSMVIAVSKCIGTLGSTLQGYITMNNLMMSGIGTLCFIFDIIYIILLYRTIQTEKAVALSPKNKKKQIAY